MIKMTTWAREELEELYPDGSVGYQVDDTVTVMSTDEWSAWIDAQVGTEKLEEFPEQPEVN